MGIKPLGSGDISVESCKNLENTIQSLEKDMKGCSIHNGSPIDMTECSIKHKNVTEIKTLQDLITKLHEIFEEDEVDVDYVMEVMRSYKSNPQEWRKYAKFDRYRYTRNLVDSGNGKFNLMTLCWGEGHGSAIHDHANAHCFMKVLEGTLSEVRFEWPEESNTDPTPSDIHENHEHDQSALKEIKRTDIQKNDVAYINDSLGLHRVENPSHANQAVSLHLYCPPFDACSVFNQRTGQRSIAKVTFWSKYGERRDRAVQEGRAPEDN